MRKIIIMIASALLAIVLSACQQTDVVANYAIKSFDKIYSAIPERIVKEDIGFTIHSPNDTESFTYGESMQLTICILPFIDAGLDPVKLSGDFKVESCEIVITAQGKGNNDTNAFMSFEKMIRGNRNALDYHLDHDIYELAIGNGNAFRWAKDIYTNERDIVFVLDPVPFIEAGLDTERLDAWRLADISIVNENGKMTEAKRLLKPYNIQ